MVAQNWECTKCHRMDTLKRLKWRILRSVIVTTIFFKREIAILKKGNCREDAALEENCEKMKLQSVEPPWSPES